MRVLSYWRLAFLLAGVLLVGACASAESPPSSPASSDPAIRPVASSLAVVLGPEKQLHVNGQVTAPDAFGALAKQYFRKACETDGASDSARVVMETHRDTRYAFYVARLDDVRDAYHAAMDVEARRLGYRSYLGASHEEREEIERRCPLDLQLVEP